MFDIAPLDVLVAGLLVGLFAGGQSEAFAVRLEDVNMILAKRAFGVVTTAQKGARLLLRSRKGGVLDGCPSI